MAGSSPPSATLPSLRPAFSAKPCGRHFPLTGYSASRASTTRHFLKPDWTLMRGWEKGYVRTIAIGSAAQSSVARLYYVSPCPTESVLNCKGKGSVSLIYNHTPKLRSMACLWGRGGSPFIHLFNEQVLPDCLSQAVIMVWTPCSPGCTHKLE